MIFPQQCYDSDEQETCETGLKMITASSVIWKLMGVNYAECGLVWAQRC